MSVVTSVTLHLSHEYDSDCMDEIQEWLRSRHLGPLKNVEDYYGDTKHPQIALYGAGYNYFCPDSFINFVVTRRWSHPENMVLIINPEEGPCAVYTCQFANKDQIR